MARWWRGLLWASRKKIFGGKRKEKDSLSPCVRTPQDVLMKDPIWFKCLVRLAIISAVSAFTLAPRHAPFERHRHVGPLRSKPESENTFGEYGEDAIDPKLSSMVDDLITAAQTGERKSGGAITKEEIAEQAEQVAAMYSKASSEIKEEMQDGQWAGHY